MTTTEAETLVTPSGDLSSCELAYWERAEALARQYVGGLEAPLTAEAHWGMYSFCAWPWCASQNLENWGGWNFCFDDALLALIEGQMLVHVGIGPLEHGWEPDAVVDGMRDFVRWLGAVGHADGEQTERICNELEFARESFVLAVSGEDDGPWDDVAGEAGCPCCAANEAVAPFVGWLRDTTSASLDRLLLGQALAICALEQLGLTSLESGTFYRLEIGPCLERAYERTWMVEGDRRELVAAARAFATFLGHRCALSGTHVRRMQAEAERWAATPVRAA